MENWFDLVGYEGKYQISDAFNVKSLDRIVVRPGTRGNMKVKGTLLKPSIDKNGYLRIKIENKSYSLHRLIAINFIPKIEGKDIINHKDGNKQNNSIENLEWCNYYENNNHSINRGKTSSGLVGVTFHKITKKWIAQIHFNKKLKNLGYYDNKEDAFKARCNFEFQNNISNCYLF